MHTIALSNALQTALDEACGLLLDPEMMQLVARADTPRVSIARGAGGAALACAELYRVTDDARLLDAAERWLVLGKQLQTDDLAAAFYGAAEFHGVNNGPAGTAWTDATIAALRGDGERRAHAILEFRRSWQQHPPQLRDMSIIAGVAGFLEASNEGLARFEGLSVAEREAFETVRREATAELSLRLAQPLKQGVRLGLGVGYAGTLFALLGNGALSVDAESRLRELSDYALHDDDDAPFWPSEAGELIPTTVRSTWCNGSAGILQLMTRLHSSRSTQATQLQKMASHAAVATAGFEPFGSTMCCGTSGAALLLYRYAQATGQSLDDFVLEFALAPSQRFPRHAVSVSPFIGVPGVALVLASLSSYNCSLPVGLSA